MHLSQFYIPRQHGFQVIRNMSKAFKIMSNVIVRNQPVGFSCSNNTIKYNAGFSSFCCVRGHPFLLPVTNGLTARSSRLLPIIRSAFHHNEKRCRLIKGLLDRSAYFGCSDTRWPASQAVENSCFWGYSIYQFLTLQSMMFTIYWIYVIVLKFNIQWQNAIFINILLHLTG